MASKNDRNKLDAFQMQVKGELNKEVPDFNLITKLNEKRNNLIFKVHKKKMEEYLKQARNKK